MSEELIKNLRIKAGMIENCESIAWGSETKLMREAADALEHQQKVIDQVRVVDKPEPPVSEYNPIECLQDMANRLQLLDGEYSWDIEVETIKAALEYFAGGE